MNPLFAITSVVVALYLFGTSIATAQSVPYIRVSFEGDSIVDQELTTWPDYLRDYSPYFAKSGVNFINYGEAGGRAWQMVTQYVTQAHLNRPTNSTDEAWFFLHAGGNDPAEGKTPTETYTDLKTMWAAARADGYKVVAVTVLPRIQTNYAALNKLILSDRTLYDYVVPADVMFLGHVSNTNYLYDTTHPSVYGAKLIAQLCATVIEATPWSMIPAGETNSIDNGMDVQLNPRGRNVGIGTSMPKGTLQVSAQLTNVATTGIYGQLELTLALDTSRRLSIGYASSPDAGFVQTLVNGQAYTPFLILPSGGNVGIGVVAPVAKLDVNGNIRATTITLTNAPTFQTTSAPPCGFVPGVTVPSEWYVVTNNAGVRKLVPGYTP